VDTNLDMVLLCREKGLHVEHADAFALLRELPEGSLGGVFCSQLVEHLPAGRVLELLRLVHRALGDGAPLVVETVNPECVLALMNFYLDPTHVRPLHPKAMQLLVEGLGFDRVEVLFSSPGPEALRIPALPPYGDPDAVERFNTAVARLNDLMYGFLDYAVVARKQAAPAAA
jgi:O-antigen chain-terminating methyltransferase